MHEGYVRQKGELLEAEGVIGLVYIEDLEDKGLRTIEMLSDPHHQLVLSLEALAEAIRELPETEVSQEEKDRAEKAAQELKTFTRGLAPGAALQMLRALAAALGIHLP